MYTTCISINTQFLLFIGKLQGGPNSYPLLVHPVYKFFFVSWSKVQMCSHSSHFDSSWLTKNLHVNEKYLLKNNIEN